MAEQDTVLIIEDRRDNVRFLTRNVLNGYQVLVARDGQEGLRVALEQSPDLVIADLSVPKKNGLQVLQELRQAGRDLPVILTTFHGTEGARCSLPVRVRQSAHPCEPGNAREDL